jgi:hypothetical protein
VEDEENGAHGRHAPFRSSKRSARKYPGSGLGVAPPRRDSSDADGGASIRLGFLLGRNSTKRSSLGKGQTIKQQDMNGGGSSSKQCFSSSSSSSRSSSSGRGTLTHPGRNNTAGSSVNNVETTSLLRHYDDNDDDDSRLPTISDDSPLSTLTGKINYRHRLRIRRWSINILAVYFSFNHGLWIRIWSILFSPFL